MNDERHETHFTDQQRNQLAYRRVLVLDKALDEDNGTALMTQLLTLAADAPTQGIALWIHSPGGSVPTMVAIRDIMKTIPCEITTVVLGWAASAGQFLLSAGTPGKRLALPHAKVLMHQGSAGLGGTAVDVELQAEDLRDTRDTTLRLIAEDTGQQVDRIFEDSLRDHWYSAQEAQDYGFVDHIVTEFAQIAPRPYRTPTGLTSTVTAAESQVSGKERI